MTSIKMWPPPVNKEDNEKWWNEFWSVNAKEGFSIPSESLIELIPNHLNGSTCIDVASGNGRYALHLARLGFKSTAFELAESGCQYIQELSNKCAVEVNVVKGDIIDSDFRKAYDLIICSGLFEEIPLDSFDSAIKGIGNLSKQDTFLITRYCLEIKGRSNIIPLGYVPSVLENNGWLIEYEHEMEDFKISKAGFTLRHGTIKAKKI
ncbi:class I SAM-dependent methyltransferase [Vibrio cholerae]